MIDSVESHSNRYHAMSSPSWLWKMSALPGADLLWICKISAAINDARIMFQAQESRMRWPPEGKGRGVPGRPGSRPGPAPGSRPPPLFGAGPGVAPGPGKVPGSSRAGRPCMTRRTHSGACLPTACQVRRHTRQLAEVCLVLTLSWGTHVMIQCFVYAKKDVCATTICHVCNGQFEDCPVEEVILAAWQARTVTTSRQQLGRPRPI